MQVGAVLCCVLLGGAGPECAVQAALQCAAGCCGCCNGPARWRLLLNFFATLLHAISAERGRSIFEGVLRNYPKRLDLWSVYLDQEVALGDEQRIR